MKGVLYFLSGVAGLGWLLMLVTHVAALLGHGGPLGGREEVFFFGLFILWAAAILASRSLSKDVPQRDFWKATLRGCPTWMKYLLYGSFFYALVNFVLAVTGGAKTGPGPAQATRAISGHLLAFYAAAFAILYSAATLWGQQGRRCSEGHPVGPLARFCDHCGRPIVDPNYGPGSH